MSALPPALVPVAAGLALGQGLWLARAGWRRPRRDIQFTARGAWLRVGGSEAAWLDGLVVQRRGPLTTLVARGSGGRVRLAWWPDTLSPGARRRLVLAATALSRHPDKPLPSVAA